MSDSRSSQKNDVELIQQFCLKYVNKKVREYFVDIKEVNEGELSTSNARHSAKLACLHKDNDPITLTIARMLTFYFACGAFEEQPFYSIPTIAFQEERKFKPQIQLYFLEDYENVEKGYSPVAGEISFRLTTETSTSITEAELKKYATKIKQIFGANHGYLWKKGKTMVSYSDWGKGYQLQLLCRDKNEGKQLVERVLEIQSHTPDWKNMSFSENQEPVDAYPIVPSNQTILGKVRKGARKRPIATVRFQYALAHIHGLPNPVILFDRTYSKRHPLVKNEN